MEMSDERRPSLHIECYSAPFDCRRSSLSPFIVFGIGGWAATMELEGAVVAQGSLVVDSNVKKVQHLSGGIVKEIRVREGDHVKAGDILVRLDETQTKAANSVVSYKSR